jgi:hypothetical protein
MRYRADREAVMTGDAERYRVLPERGTLLVSTDLHGNGEDYRRMETIFRSTLAQDPETHWVILGDTVHGPDPLARVWKPALYDYPDESYRLVEAILELQEEIPGRVHYVLGNHDYGHIGGPHPAKFYEDEVEQLESTLDASQRATLRRLFGSALLAVVAPCGVLLTHGSPDDRLSRLDELHGIQLPPDSGHEDHEALLESILTPYGQPPGVTARLLAKLSTEDLRLTFVVHGHDRDEHGWYADGGNQLCPVIFGAPRLHKRYLRLDLAARYRGTEDLADGREIRRLHAAPAPTP